MEVDVAKQQQPTSLEQIGQVDLLIGLMVDVGDQAINLLESLRAIPGSPRIAVLQGMATSSGSPATEAAPGDSVVMILPWAIQSTENSPEPLHSLGAGYHSLFGLASKLGARGSCVITSKLSDPAAEWIAQLVRPLVDGDFDLVVPNYAPRKFEGLLNSGLIYPLIRALYGKRVGHPMGPDLAVSSNLAAKVASPVSNSSHAPKPWRSLESFVPAAVCGNLKICETYVGARLRPPADWTNVSSVIEQVLGPVFLEVERNAACWQHNRPFVPIPATGQRTYPQDDGGPVDVTRLVTSFQLGARELQDLWGLVLPPNSLFQLKKCSALAPAHFAIPDELWARVVYDFALAHRLQTMNRGHLLRSLTPLYLGWVASYAREMERATARQAEQRIERLAQAFEAAKSYFVSRWRWPDRFNP